MDNYFGKFSPHLKQVLILAERIANDLNDQLDTQHLVLSIVTMRDNLSSDILKNYDVTPQKLDVLSRLLHENKPSVNKTTISEDMKSALMSAIKIASNLGQEQVETEHLLLSLVSDSKLKSYQIIERAGADPNKIKDQLTEMFKELSQAINQNQDFFDQMHPENMDGGFDMPGDGPAFGMPGVAGATQTKEKSMLETYGTDLTQQSSEGKLDPVIGRDKEIERVIQILSRRTKNNPILLGEPGVGKTSIVEGLADKIIKGRVPNNLLNKRVIMLDLGAIVAGTMFRGQFESRFKKIIEEIQKDGNTIIFLDELHTVIGTGSAEGSLDAANLLKPMLARGQLRMIGATTFDEYKKNIEKDKAFERRFQIVKISEPTVDETVKILKGLQKRYEQYHGISYEPDAILAAAKLSDRYVSDRFMPDKAIDLIDEAAAAKNVVTKSSSEIITHKRRLDDIGRQKEDAVRDENYQKATQLREEEIKINNRLDELETKRKKEMDSVVTEEDVAKIVANSTGIPVTDLKTKESVHLTNLESRLRKYIVGQDEAVKSISQAIKRSRVGIGDPNRPIGSFIFLGPTGVGKTELAKVLAKIVFGSEKALIKMDMSEFMERHNVSRLVGAPAGYVGYEEGGKLTEQVRHQPYSLVLFDEIEKAHPDVYNLLLQILEDGYLTDAKGRRVNFKNTMIIMTSNLGSNLFQNKSIGFDLGSKSSEVKEQILENLRRNVPPEFINRLDGVVVFNRLKRTDLDKIVNLRLKELASRLKEHKLVLEVTLEAKDYLVEKGFDEVFGARPLKRLIADKIESQISDLMLKTVNLSDKTLKIDRLDQELTVTVI